MYNLVKFIIKYHFAILFVLLEIIACTLIFQNNKYHQVKFLNASNFLTGSVYNFKTQLSNYLNLVQINEKLAAENAYLKNQAKEISYVQIPRLFNDTLVALDTLIIDTSSSYNYLPAKVIGNSINKQLNIVYVNKGSLAGFDVDMGVVNKDGVVGIVRNVSENYAIITPIINREFNVNAKIKNSGFFGNLSWDGNNPVFAQLNDIPNHITPNTGDTIITSGYSHIFQEGEVIGYIEKVNTIPGKSFINIDVRLAVEFGNLDYIYGIQNSVKLELDTIRLEN